MVSKSDILLQYKHLSPQDQRTFDRWLKANAVVGSMLAAGLVVMGLSGSHATLGAREAAANSGKATELSASAQRRQPDADLSAYELMIRIAPDQLPVMQVDEPF